MSHSFPVVWAKRDSRGCWSCPNSDRLHLQARSSTLSVAGGGMAVIWWSLGIVSSLRPESVLALNREEHALIWCCFLFFLCKTGSVLFALPCDLAQPHSTNFSFSCPWIAAAGKWQSDMTVGGVLMNVREGCLGCFQSMASATYQGLGTTGVLILHISASGVKQVQALSQVL